jgi:hypothetical protein
VKRRQREIDLEADIRAARGKGDFIAERKMEAEIRSIQDSHKRMSIWPLIEANEFSAISNGHDPSPFAGSPEGGVFRLLHDGRLVMPP